MPEIKQNFFIGSGRAAKKETPQVTLPMIRWMNDPEFRRDYGMWLYERFDSLVDEYKKRGRFPTLQEIVNS